MGGALLCLGHFASPLKGHDGGTPLGAPWVCGGDTNSHLSLQDKTLKCTVYRIRGSVSASNYIQLPKTSTQSLGLTGRYLYVLFRPLSTKHFIIHLDVSTEVLSSGRGGCALGSCTPAATSYLLTAILCPPLQDGQVIRVSLSNLFKEFKSTATWLQFPFICEAGTTRKGDTEMEPKWDTNSPGKTARGQKGRWGRHFVLAMGMGAGQEQKVLWADW